MKPDLQEQLKQIKPIKVPKSAKWKLFFYLLKKAITPQQTFFRMPEHQFFQPKYAYSFVMVGLSVLGSVYLVGPIIAPPTTISPTNLVVTSPATQTEINPTKPLKIMVAMAPDNLEIADQVEIYLRNAEAARDKLLAQLAENPELIAHLDNQTKSWLGLTY